MKGIILAGGRTIPLRVDTLNNKSVISRGVLSPVKLTLIKTKTQYFLSDQIVVIFRHGLVISLALH